MDRTFFIESYKKMQIIKMTMVSGRKGAFNPIDLIAGAVLIFGGALTIYGNVNMGAVLAGLGLLIEAVKMLVQKGP